MRGLRKASKLAREIAENAVREPALPLGFVDVKVCAVDEVWPWPKRVLHKPLR